MKNTKQRNQTIKIDECETSIFSDGSNKKVDLMIKEFEKGRKEPFHYQAKPYGEVIFVTLSPIIKNGVFLGCVQTVRSSE